MKAGFTSMAVLQGALWALVAVQVSHASAQGQRRSTEQVPSGTSVSTSRVELRATLDTSCVACHNDRLKTANLTLQSGDIDLVGVHPEAWEKVARKLRTREMPPPGRPRPDAATYGAVAARSRPRSTRRAPPVPIRVASRFIG